MTTMFRRKQRHNPSWLLLLCRRIGDMYYYKRKNMSWVEAWDMAGKMIN